MKSGNVIASHADVLRLVTRFSPWEERVTSLRTSAWEANVWPAGRYRTAVRQAMHFFVNFDIFKWLYLANYWVYLHQTWAFCEYRCALLDYVDQ